MYSTLNFCLMRSSQEDVEYMLAVKFAHNLNYLVVCFGARRQINTEKEKQEVENN